MNYTHSIVTTTGYRVLTADLAKCEAYYARHCGASFGWRIVEVSFAVAA